VYFPDFITSCRRLLMFSWLFFCGYQGTNQLSAKDILKDTVLNVRSAVAAATAAECCSRQCCMVPTVFLDAATILKFLPPSQPAAPTCDRISIGRASAAPSQVERWLLFMTSGMCAHQRGSRGWLKGCEKTFAERDRPRALPGESGASSRKMACRFQGLTHSAGGTANKCSNVSVCLLTTFLCAVRLACV
jgi:hypothetical protein